MMTEYTFKVAMSSILREKWINLLSALTIATGLLITSTALFILYNVEIATKRLPERFTMTVFLKDDVQDDKAKLLIQTVNAKDAVKDVKFISKADALKELKSVIKDTDYLLDGVDENPLPASLEIVLKKEFVSEESVKAFSTELKKLDGIDDVKYGEKFLTTIQNIKSAVEGIGVSIISALTAAIIFVCYSTIKILFYRRKEEIETLQLLGATRGFIRAPFVIEGGLIGLSGGVIALIALGALKKLASGKLAMSIPMLGGLVLPPAMYLLPVVGILIGVVGALTAIGKIRL